MGKKLDAKRPGVRRTKADGEVPLREAKRTKLKFGLMSMYREDMERRKCAAEFEQVVGRRMPNNVIDWRAAAVEFDFPNAHDCEINEPALFAWIIRKVRQRQHQPRTPPAPRSKVQSRRKPISHARRAASSKTAIAPSISIQALKELLCTSARTVNKYGKLAGVDTPQRGQKNFRFPHPDAIKPVRKIHEIAAEKSLRQSAETALISLRKPQSNCNTEE